MAFEFEDQFSESIEEIRRRIFDNIEALWPDPNNRPDVREGSLLWTIFYPLIAEVQTLQVLLNRALELGFLQFTVGEFLDLKGIELGLERKQGEESSGYIRFLGADGSIVPAGTEISTIAIGLDEDTFAYETTTADTIVGIPNPANENEVQLVKVSGTGTFKITFDGVETTTAFNETDNGLAIAAAINLEINSTPNYTGLNAVTVTGNSGVANSDGATITFDGGLVDGNDVPLLQVTSTTGSIVGTVTEVEKGRAAAAVLGTTNQNEIQTLNYTPSELVASVEVEGSDGDARNEIQQLSFSAIPSSGSFDLTYDSGDGTPVTITVDWDDNESDLTSKFIATPDVSPGDVLITSNGPNPAISGFHGIDDGPSSASYLIEFKGNLRSKNYNNMIVSNNTLNNGAVPTITSVQNGSTGINEKQKIEYTNGVPTGGYFTLTLQDNVGGSAASLLNVPYNVGAGQLQSLLETIPTYSNGTDPSGTNFSVSGGPLDQAALHLEYRGKNRAIDFKLPTFTEFFSGAPTSGTFRLVYNDGVTTDTTNNIPYNATAANVQTYLEGLSNVLPGEVQVSVILGGPTLDVFGTVMEIEFIGAKSNIPYNLMTVTSDTLAPEPAGATVLPSQDGTGGQNEIQLLTATHPIGLFKAKFGGLAPVTTNWLSTLTTTAGQYDTELEALGEIGAGNLTVTGGPLVTNPVVVEFSGVPVAGEDHPNIEIVNNLVDGGVLGTGPLQAQEFAETQVGFGGVGVVSGNVQYVYTLVTKIGVQDNATDVDYEPGFGETQPSTPSGIIAVANNKVLVQIKPVVRTQGLHEIRRVNVYRSLNGGAYKFIDSIEEEDISFTYDGDPNPPSYMHIVDNIPAATFAAITTIVPAVNRTGVVDIPAQALEVGDEYNVAARVITILDDSVTGVEAVTNPEPFGGGSDIESDDDYRERLIEEAQKDPGAGNIDDYVGWAKEVPGIDSVSVLPEWQEIYGPLEGPGTVKVIVAGPNVTVIDDESIEEVRQHIAGSIAIPDPNQDAAPATLALPGGNIEDGVYEYCYTFINVGKGETKPTPFSRVEVGSGDNSVELSLERGQSGVGVQNTIGRRIYRQKVDGPIPGEAESDRMVLVAEVLNNEDEVYTDSAAYLSLPTWLGYPNGPYQRRKAPKTNSTSLYDGVSPIGAHVTVESISAETIFVNATIYPETGYSVDGIGGTVDLTLELDTAFQSFFATLPSGHDVLIKDVENVIHDHPGVKDFKDVKMFSPAHPLGTTDNISIGPGVSASYSSAGTFTFWYSYPFDA